MTAVGDKMIDRRALVTRHNPGLHVPDPLAPLSVGNGEFAFTADITGLQTFPELYRGDGDPRRPGATPLGTQAQWGWHSFPNPEGYRLEDSMRDHDTYGRPVSYPYVRSPIGGEQPAASKWLRENPHRLHLGRIGLDLKHADGSPASVDDLEDVVQTLDLWTGILESRFALDGARVRVRTCCHPERDLIGVSITSSLVRQARLGVRVRFPYGGGEHSGEGTDWDSPQRHQTVTSQVGAKRRDFRRQLDATCYHVALEATQSLATTQVGPHDFLIAADEPAESLDFVVAFAQDPILPDLPASDQVRSASSGYWERFWSSGGAVELAGSSDPRAHELERRIILSQYLMAIQCAGSLPPQETGLTYNSWYGKFHLEMHWWHEAHFALWGRIDLLERSLGWYDLALPMAQATARRQGYAGARWPKMVGPDGNDSPSNVGPFLIWQQPHPIYFAELCYRAHPDRATLERFRNVIFETAEFMASYAVWRPRDGRYVLGPPLIPAQERFPPEAAYNPTFELEYWVWGLDAAQRWRERLGLERNPGWQVVRERMSPLPIVDGCYVNAESHPDTFAPGGQRTDHPSLLGACGILPGITADKETMRRTLLKVMETWAWDTTWGWDFPMTAMTAARVGEPGLAVDALLMDAERNTYLANGHNYNRRGLSVYLPGNGGLLTAVAMMAAGWDGGPESAAPGFPADGAWRVRWEGLERMP